MDHGGIEKTQEQDVEDDGHSDGVIDMSWADIDDGRHRVPVPSTPSDYQPEGDCLSEGEEIEQDEDDPFAELRKAEPIATRTRSSVAGASSSRKRRRSPEPWLRQARANPTYKKRKQPKRDQLASEALGSAAADLIMYEDDDRYSVPPGNRQNGPGEQHESNPPPANVHSDLADNEQAVSGSIGSRHPKSPSIRPVVGEVYKCYWDRPNGRPEGWYFVTMLPVPAKDWDAIYVKPGERWTSLMVAGSSVDRQNYMLFLDTDWQMPPPGQEAVIPQEPTAIALVWERYLYREDHKIESGDTGGITGGLATKERFKDRLQWRERMRAVALGENLENENGVASTTENEVGP